MAQGTFDAKELTGDNEALTPAEIAAQFPQSDGIGQARFRNRIGMEGAPKIINKLPEGANPAGWFIVGGQYVNCDGFTPEELEAQSPEYHKGKAQEARAQADKAINAEERALLRIETMQNELRAKEQELHDLRTQVGGNTNNELPTPPAGRVGK